MADEPNPSVNARAAAARDAADPSPQVEGTGPRKRGREQDDLELLGDDAPDDKRARLDPMTTAFGEEISRHAGGLSGSVEAAQPSYENSGEAPSPEASHVDADLVSDSDTISVSSDKENQLPSDGRLADADRERGALLDISRDFGASSDFELPDQYPPTPQSLNGQDFEIWSDEPSNSHSSPITTPSDSANRAAADTPPGWYETGIFDENSSLFPSLEDSGSPAPAFVAHEAMSVDAGRAEAAKPLASSAEATPEASEPVDKLQQAALKEIEGHFARQAEEFRSEVDSNSRALENFQKYYGINPQYLMNKTEIYDLLEQNEAGHYTRLLKKKENEYYKGKLDRPESPEVSKDEKERGPVDAESLRGLLREYQRSDLNLHRSVTASLEEERLAGAAELKRALARKPQPSERASLKAAEQARMEAKTEQAWREYSSPEYPIHFMKDTLIKERKTWERELQKDVKELRRKHREEQAPGTSDYKIRQTFKPVRAEFEARHGAAMDADGYQAMDAMVERVLRQHAADPLAVGNAETSRVEGGRDSRDNERENGRQNERLRGR